MYRGVVQLASMLAWGASGRPFESGHSDTFYLKEPLSWGSFFCYFLPQPMYFNNSYLCI